MAQKVMKQKIGASLKKQENLKKEEISVPINQDNALIDHKVTKQDNPKNNLEKVHILLMTPPCIDLYKGLRDVAPISPPLGLLYVASVLEKKSASLKIMDAFAENLDWHQIEEKFKQYNPDILGLTCVTSTFGEVAKIAGIAKKSNPNITVVVGGPHVTATPKQTLEKYPEMDIIVIGEGDYTLLDIDAALQENRELKAVKGIAYRKDNQIIVTPPRPMIHNLDEVPFPARHLVKNELYKPPTHISGRDSFFSILSSRGCPNLCTFCSSKITFGSAIRYRSPENVLEEIKQSIKFVNTNYLVFMDDTFTVNKERVLIICKMLKELNITWGSYARVNTVDEEMLIAMKDAGCNWIGFGVESGSQDILNKVKKGITIEQVRKAFKITKKLGIATTAFFILGHLDETHETIKETIKFAKEIDADFAQFNVLTPYPGTEVYERASREGLILRDFEDYGNPKYKDPVIKLKTMNNHELKRYWKKATYGYYLRPKMLFKFAKNALINKDERRRLFDMAVTFVKFNV